jgi:hypothetical protein
VKAEGGVGDRVGDDDGVASREAAEAPREVASMAWRQGTRRRIGWENWVA